VIDAQCSESKKTKQVRSSAGKSGRLKCRHQIQRPKREVTMTTQTNHPSKYVVREYLERRSQDVKPPPTPEEIRRQLGWGLMMFEQKISNGRS
jgi:hypothetical protein